MGLSLSFHRSTTPLLHLASGRIEAHVSQINSGDGKHSLKSLSSAQVVQE